MAVKEKKKLSPARLIIILFFVLIIVGTVLLMLPFSLNNGQSIRLIDALFIATSAVSSTGLSVVNIAETFSVPGQIIIMILVQIGGLGFMTLGVLIAILLGKRIGIRHRLFIQETTQLVSSKGLVRLSLYVLLIAVIFESIATVVLTLRFMSEMPLLNAFYNGMFHSVTAFNNAGFVLFDDSFIRYSTDPLINITIMTLIIFGGLGFIVIVDLFRVRKFSKFTLHTKMVLMASFILIVFGFLVILLLEYFNANTQFTSFYHAVTTSLFQSVTARSAGYNTLDIGSMVSSSQFVIIILMFIGGASSSTGGGIKVNTFVIISLATLNTFKGGGPIHFLKRSIPHEAVLRALAVVISSITAVILVTLILSITEDFYDNYFIEILFESVSAVSTAGLSLGLTPHLSDAGKLIISITMLIGRLGPLTLGYALAKKSRVQKINYPEEKVLIG